MVSSLHLFVGTENKTLLVSLQLYQPMNSTRNNEHSVHTNWKEVGVSLPILSEKNIVTVACLWINIHFHLNFRKKILIDFNIINS